ncbi:nucleotidyltransferase family protein [Paenibacillus xerothermodurans]|uniref:nucleotidyltransferase family protein n=1 Tax=Paenibacillus xerothermodurans TaxID=1977292 RepID=UPI0014029027|nr:nucleotidyltransferase family protein [Paenibacillus xerothermodurans]
MVILAGGYSRRMGPGIRKLLLPIGEEAMLRHVTSKALLTKASGVAVVVNAEFPELAECIGDLPVVILPNYNAALGMSSSLRIAIDYFVRIAAQGACVMLADQPGMEPAVIDEVMDRYEETEAKLVQAAYQGKPGHPVLFSPHLFEELRQIIGDKGAREIIRKYAEARELVHISGDEPQDIDIYEDYESWMAKGGCLN